MSELENDLSTSYLNEVLKDLRAEINSSSYDELRRLLITFNQVENILQSVRKEYRIQINRGTNIVEEYQRSRSNEIDYLVDKLDYIVRMDNVGLQISIQLKLDEEFVIDLETLNVFNRVLLVNPQTVEIIIVWDSKELLSMSMSIDDVQFHLNQHREDESPLVIDPMSLSPLRETIIATYEKYRPVFSKSSQLQEMKAAKFNFTDEFINILNQNLGDLKDSLPRRRAEEIILAIQSISQEDIIEIQKVFLDSYSQNLSLDELKNRLNKISENIELNDS